MPIGNLTSQFWSNVYINALDRHVIKVLGCQAYLRYVDDFALFSDSKSKLWAWKQAIIDFLSSKRLTIHDRSAQVMPVADGIPWLGFVVYPTHRKLKRRNAVNFRRRLRSTWTPMRLDGSALGNWTRACKAGSTMFATPIPGDCEAIFLQSIRFQAGAGSVKRSLRERHRIVMKAEELDELFDRGEDITRHLDVATRVRPGRKPQRVSVDFPDWMIDSLDREAGRVGVTRQSIIKMWIAERLTRKL